MHSTSSDDLFRPDVLKTIKDELQTVKAELRELSLKIHGELGSIQVALLTNSLCQIILNFASKKSEC